MKNEKGQGTNDSWYRVIKHKITGIVRNREDNDPDKRPNRDQGWTQSVISRKIQNFVPPQTQNGTLRWSPVFSQFSFGVTGTKIEPILAMVRIFIGKKWYYYTLFVIHNKYMIIHCNETHNV